ncbi:cytochrome P450 [Hypoxylon sp. NC1633]|nr:cytochrome P450 [Hypoxylon sp. NC1633]
MDLITCGGLTALELVALQFNNGLARLSSFKTFFAVVLLQYTLLRLYRIILYPTFISPLRNLPGPKDHNLVLGQEVKKFKAESPSSIQLQWMRKWPEAPFIRYLSLAGKEVLLVNSLAAHRAVLQTNVYDFVKPPFFARLVGEIAGVGLLFAEGDMHRRERRLLAGPFSVPSMRKLLPVFRRKAKDLSKTFEHLLGVESHATIETIEAFSKSTMDTIGVTVLGIELDTLSSMYPRSFQELYGQLLHQGALGQLISVVNAFVPIRNIVPLKANYDFIKASADLRQMLRDIIQKRAADLADGTFGREKGESRDLLTYMLEEAELRRQETGKEVWSVDDILGHMIGSKHQLTTSLLGHETTATTLTWSLYVLATDHAVQDQLRSEIKSLLETDPEPDYDAISGLPYLHNFVREVLRVYSPDLLIEGVPIPKGTQIDLNIALAHQHPAVWGPDAASFNPARWDALSGAAATPFAFAAFLQGPRTCPGRSFALAQVKAVLVELVPRWRFLGIAEGGGKGARLRRAGEECVGRGVRLANPSLTNRPAGGLFVRFERLA